jgi:hypothetical protein
MVASIFVIQGYDTFRRPERVAPRAGRSGVGRWA